VRERECMTIKVRLCACIFTGPCSLASVFARPVCLCIIMLLLTSRALPMLVCIPSFAVPLLLVPRASPARDDHV
jgi:hypothetical protein